MTREGFLAHAARIYRGARSVLRAVPPDLIDHRPQPSMMSVGQLIRHMASACGGAFEFALHFRHEPAAPPHTEPRLDSLRSHGSAGDALAHLDRDEQALRRTVLGLSEEEFQTREVPLPWSGETVPVWMLALLMADHLSVHRMQLFQYLRAAGLPVDTGTLYGS